MFDYLATSLDSLEILLIFLLVALASYFIGQFLGFIGKMLLINRAGEKWYMYFIPFYNQYLLCKISGTNIIWLFLRYGSLLLVLVNDDIVFIPFICYVAFSIVLAASISKSFGKGVGTTFGLLFLAPIFYLILGITGDYKGPLGCNDPIFGNVNFGNTKQKENPYKYNPTSIVNEKKSVKYQFCPGCGFRLSDTDNYCPGCGREL